MVIILGFLYFLVHFLFQALFGVWFLKAFFFFSVLLGEMEPEVTFHSIGIVSEGCGEVSTPLPVDEGQGNRILFTLREGSQYRLKLTFTVQHNIVSGLTYSNTVWKGGLQGI